MDVLKSTKISDNVFYICIFIFLVYMNFQIPLVNDAWINSGSYLEKGGFAGWVAFCHQWYLQVNGRFMAIFVTGFFEQYETLLKISNSFLFFSIFFMFTLFYRKNNCKQVLIPIGISSLFFLVDSGIRAEVYFYAQMFYLTPLFLILIFIFFLEKIAAQKLLHFRQRISFYSCTFFISCWIEHIAIGFVLAIFSLAFVCYRKRILTFSQIWPFLCSATLGIVFLFSSPGLTKASRPVFSKDESIYSIFTANIIEILSAVILKNPMIYLFLCVGLLLYTAENRMQLKRLTNLFISINSILIIIFGILLIAEVSNSSARIATYLTDNNIFVLGLTLLLIFVLAAPLISSSIKLRIPYFFAILLSIFSLSPLTLIIDLEPRITSIAVFFSIFLTLLVWSYLKDQAIAQIRLALWPVFLAILLLGYGSFLNVVNEIAAVQKNRDIQIASAVATQKLNQWSESKILTLPRFKLFRLMYNASPQQNTFHYSHFLKYYGLNDHTLVAFNDSKDELELIIKNGQIFLTFRPIAETSTKNIFVMFRKEIIVAKSELITSATFTFVEPTEPGVYSFECESYNAAGSITITRAARTFVVK